MNNPLTPVERRLLTTYKEIAERFGPEMGEQVSFVQRDLEQNWAGGYTKSLLSNAAQYGYQVIMDGVSRNTPNRVESSLVNCNQLYEDAAEDGHQGLMNLTLNLLEIGWDNFARLRNIPEGNPFELISGAGSQMRIDIEHEVLSEGNLLSFLVWFTGILCEDQRFLVRYMITVNYQAIERRSVVEFEFTAHDPGVVGLVIAHGQTLATELLR